MAPKSPLGSPRKLRSSEVAAAGGAEESLSPLAAGPRQVDFPVRARMSTRGRTKEGVASCQSSLPGSFLSSITTPPPPTRKKIIPVHPELCSLSV